MPPYPEVRHYLSGLWLMAKGDAQGMRMLDISDRGLTRSFWAFLWCLPAMVISWVWWRSLFLDAMPPETPTGGVFFIRLAMLEVLDWILPLVLVGVVCALFGLAEKFVAIVVAFNWMSIPFAYAYAAIAVVLMLHLKVGPLLAIGHLGLLLAMIFCSARILRMICGPQPVLIAAFVMVMLVPDMLIAEFFQRFLGVYPG